MNFSSAFEFYPIRAALSVSRRRVTNGYMRTSENVIRVLYDVRTKASGFRSASVRFGLQSTTGGGEGRGKDRLRNIRVFTFRAVRVRQSSSPPRAVGSE